MIKQVALYTWVVVCLGVFTGIFMSMGSHMWEAIGVSCLFWACMLMGMLGK